jgi:hypothetical protein
VTEMTVVWVMLLTLIFCWRMLTITLDTEELLLL